MQDSGNNKLVVPDLSDILEVLSYALKQLYSNEYKLIFSSTKEGQHNHEICIVHHFARYANIYKDEHKIGEELSIDIEYNRNLGKKKEIDKDNHLVRPDFIWHERNKKENNFVVIEFKTWWNPSIEDDVSKIRYFLNDERYKYQYGFVIYLDKTLEASKVLYVVNRKDVIEYSYSEEEEKLCQKLN